MKIYDCFQFFDEEMLLNLRLNILNKYINKFVITEANYTHNGNPKKLNFDINKFSKFKEKIIYIVVDNPPPNLSKIYNNDTKQKKHSKKSHSMKWKVIPPWAPSLQRPDWSRLPPV